jgi:hypothetical protein
MNRVTTLDGDKSQSLSATMCLAVSASILNQS